MLVLTIDVPVRTTRSREAAVGLGRGPFRPSLPMLIDMLRSPAWLAALMRHGRPKFSNFKAYAGPGASGDEVIRFTRQELGGGFTWDEIARFRDLWRRPLVLKGILHPQDAAKAAEYPAAWGRSKRLGKSSLLGTLSVVYAQPPPVE